MRDIEPTKVKKKKKKRQKGGVEMGNFGMETSMSQREKMRCPEVQDAT